MTQDSRRIDGRYLMIAQETAPGQGEDAYAAETDALGGLLCVADGCGGIGSRRYTRLEGRTEAYMAARITVQCVREWVLTLDGHSLPADAQAARSCAEALRTVLRERLTAFHAEHRNEVDSRLIMRGLQRTLPTTLCAALMDARKPGLLSCVFFWAGDSRGYILTPKGLRQCTADHVAGRADALENLYRDARLSNMVNADGDFHIDTYGLTLDKPCIVLTATDGAFGYLPTPMEFELLLLSTLEAAADLHGWQTRLHNAIRKYASDDATLTLACYGAEDFPALQLAFTGRRAALQQEFVTPVRRRRQNIEFARSLWADYRLRYELPTEVCDADWRL